MHLRDASARQAAAPGAVGRVAGWRQGQAPEAGARGGRQGGRLSLGQGLKKTVMHFL